MESVSGLPLVFLVLLCGVNSQGNQSDESGLGDHDDDPTITPAPPNSSEGERRDILPDRYVDSTGKEIRWSHSLDISFQTDLPEDEDKRWLKNAEILKNVLQDMELDFSNPKGFSISLQDYGRYITIKRSHINVRRSVFVYSELEGITATTTRNPRNGKLTCFFPALAVRQGDELLYDMIILYGGGSFQVYGILNIEEESLVIKGYTTEVIRFCPPVLPDVNLATSRGAGGVAANGAATYRWSHQLVINSTYDEIFTNRSAASWLAWTEEFKKKLERDLNFYFVNTKLPGLMITVVESRREECAGDLLHVRVLAFDIKLNEEFKSFDSGHYVANITRTRDGWNFYFPGSKLKDGDKVFYRMRVVLGMTFCSDPEYWDNTVRGVLVVTQERSDTGSTDINSEMIEFCPSSSLVRLKTFQGVENYQNLTTKKSKLSIQPTYPGAFTEGTDEKLRKDVQLLRNTLLNDTVFKFLNPVGLRISISGDSLIILAFKIKLNEEFQDIELSYNWENNTRHEVNQWRYFYPNLKVKEGDKVHYWMRVIFGEEKWDGNVRGMVEVTKNTQECTHPFPGGCGAADPHLRAHAFKTSYASLSPSPLASASKRGKEGEAFRWSYQLTIHPTRDTRFSPQSARKWLEDAKLLRTALEKSIDFKFSTPKGLKISITDNDMYHGDISLRFELNGEDKRADESSGASDGSSGVFVYNYPDLEVKPGDKIDCYFSTPFKKHDVKVNMEITDP